MSKPLLSVLVGLPRSGKSTYATERAHVNAASVVCCDEIRKAMGVYPFVPDSEPMVRFIEEKMARALFGAGSLHVIIDSTNLTHDIRKKWRNVATAAGARIRFLYATTPVETCVRRARLTNQEYLVPVIERMWHQHWDNGLFTMDELMDTMVLPFFTPLTTDAAGRGIPWSEPGAQNGACE